MSCHCPKQVASWCFAAVQDMDAAGKGTARPTHLQSGHIGRDVIVCRCWRGDRIICWPRRRIETEQAIPAHIELGTGVLVEIEFELDVYRSRRRAAELQFGPTSGLDPVEGSGVVPGIAKIVGPAAALDAEGRPVHLSRPAATSAAPGPAHKAAGAAVATSVMAPTHCRRRHPLTCHFGIGRAFDLELAPWPLPPQRQAGRITTCWVTSEANCPEPSAFMTQTSPAGST